MTYAIVRKGDKNSDGGKTTGARNSVRSSSVPLAAYRSGVTPHPCCGRKGCNAHCNAKVTGGAPTVHANGKPVHVVSDSDTCGHSRVQGDKTVLVYK